MVRTEAQKKAQKNYVMKNREKINEINRKSQQKRYNEDEEYRENRKQRSRDRNKKLKEKKQMEKALEKVIEEREKEIEVMDNIKQDN